MIVPALLAALAAIPTVIAQDVTASATRCTTRFGFVSVTSVPTLYQFATTTNLINVTYTTRDTVVITASATTFTDKVTTTETVETTTTSTPVATTIATPAGFMPLLVDNLANPTPIPRIKRHNIEAREIESALHIFRRQTAANHTGGFAVSRNGETSDTFRQFARRVDCAVTVTVNRTTTTIITGAPETDIVAGPTATALSTVTVSTTTTITEVLPRETIYAACQRNNVVNSITGFTGETLVFDRVVYRPAEGFPIENQLIVNTTSATNCCIACQRTAFCAGSFFVPSDQECHLRLTQPPAAPVVSALPAPSALPTGFLSRQPELNGTALFNSSGLPRPGYAFPSGTGVVAIPLSTSTPIPIIAPAPLPATCAKGSMSLYLGTIQGQMDFPEEFALSFSNGPCGRLSVWPVPIDDSLDTSLEDRKKLN